MLIDVHCHVVPPEIAGDPAAFARKDPHFAWLCGTKGARFCTGEDLLRTMARQDVDKAVVFGFAFRDLGVSRLQNDYAISLAKEHPGRLVALGVFDPECPGALGEAERCLSHGARGFGELFPAGHGFSLEGEAMTRLSSLAKEAGVPLLVHVNELVGHEYPGKGNQGPRDAYRFAAKNPDTELIFAHLGGGLPFYAAMPEVKELENAYYDIAAAPLLYGPPVYRVLKAADVLDRILFGSDYPLLSCRRYMRDLVGSGVSDDDLSRITSENAMKLFGKFFSTGS